MSAQKSIDKFIMSRMWEQLQRLNVRQLKKVLDVTRNELVRRKLNIRHMTADELEYSLSLIAQLIERKENGRTKQSVARRKRWRHIFSIQRFRWSNRKNENSPDKNERRRKKD